jgi:ParB family chromosome partitioning protein
MIAIARRIPSPVIDAIGPAPGTGRDRWTDMANLFEEGVNGSERCSALLERKTFQEADSDTRFGQLFDFVLSGSAELTAKSGTAKAPVRREVQQWGPSVENSRVVSLTHNTRVATLAIDRRFAPGFGEFLLSRMDELFSEYSLASGDEDSAVDQREKKTALRR